ncbi:hypothetical protein BC831DRAFT_442823 [Entophlyctis helioformis]|nr:hypothetical protein BC831DRAFT_442823 [Entophlyctis helioformis]
MVGRRRISQHTLAPCLQRDEANASCRQVACLGQTVAPQCHDLDTLARGKVELVGVAREVVRACDGECWVVGGCVHVHGRWWQRSLLERLLVRCLLLLMLLWWLDDLLRHGCRCLVCVLVVLEWLLVWLLLRCRRQILLVWHNHANRLERRQLDNRRSQQILVAVAAAASLAASHPAAPCAAREPLGEQCGAECQTHQSHDSEDDKRHKHRQREHAKILVGVWRQSRSWLDGCEHGRRRRQLWVGWIDGRWRSNRHASLAHCLAHCLAVSIRCCWRQ